MTFVDIVVWIFAAIGLIAVIILAGLFAMFYYVDWHDKRHSGTRVHPHGEA